MKKLELMTPEEHTDIYKIMSETVVRSDTQIASEEVRRGAAILDHKHPGWFNKINLDTFDISDGTECVFGQLYGKYNHNTLGKIFRTRGHAGESFFAKEQRREKVSVEHGFNTGEGGADDFEELQDSWVQAIRSRQKAYKKAYVGQ